MFAKLEDYRGCLSHLCYDSSKARRRRPYDDSDAILVLASDPFMADWLAINNCGGIRRLQRKTQVYASPKSSHIRDRLVHSMEVSSYSALFCNIAGLNAWLAVGIGLGHDLGHTPLGHFGEKKLAELSGLPFTHDAFSVVIAQEIERKGRGLNLTCPVLLGMRYHSGSDMSKLPEGIFPAEGVVAKYIDKIAYVWGDINDAKRNGIKVEEKIPWLVDVFGHDQRARIQTCLLAMFKESAEKGRVSFEESKEAEAFRGVKKVMYEQVYPDMDQWKLAGSVIERLYEAVERRYPECHPGIALATLTDADVRDACELLLYRDTLPEGFTLEFDEIYPYIKGRDIDFTNPDLEWGRTA